MSDKSKPRYTLTIGRLLEKLDALPARYDNFAIRMEIAGEYSNVGGFHAYRGLYCTLAIWHNSPHVMTKKSFVTRLKRIVNRQLAFRGYKGGSYTYGNNSLIWTSRDIECSHGYAILDADVIGEKQQTCIVLRTGYINKKQIHAAAPRISEREILSVEMSLESLFEPMVTHRDEKVVIIPERRKAVIEHCLSAIPKLIEEIKRLKDQQIV